MNYYHTLLHEPMLVLEIAETYVKFEFDGVISTMPRAQFDKYVKRNILVKTTYHEDHKVK